MKLCPESPFNPAFWRRGGKKLPVLQSPPWEIEAGSLAQLSAGWETVGWVSVIIFIFMGFLSFPLRKSVAFQPRDSSFEKGLASGNQISERWSMPFNFSRFLTVSGSLNQCLIINPRVCAYLF